TSYSKVGSLKKGAKVTILSTSKGWHKIEMSGGKTGWVSEDYVKITTSGNTDDNNNNNNNNNGSGTIEKKTGTVTADALNVRSGAGTNYDKIGTLKKGEKVTILSTSKGWHKIEMSGGKTGWVSSDYIKIGSTSEEDSNDNNGTQKPLPKPTNTPSYVDAPVNSAVMNSKYDEYQGLLTMNADTKSGLKSLAVKVNEDFGIDAEVEYEVYANGSWKKASNGAVASNSNKTIEGVRVKLKNAPSDYHVLYRVKVANQGWQNWVKDGDISGEIQNGKSIEDIEIRVVVDQNVNSMIKQTIAIDLGHNVPRPVVRGAVNGIYDEDYLIREVTKKVVYKLRSMGYNVVETKPSGSHSQSDELKVRAQIANANEADQFVSIHFNSGPSGSNGTEVLYSNASSSKARAERVSKNVSEAFGFKNRGAKYRDNLYVLNNTKMPAILVEGAFLDDIDMNKFIAKGSNAYSIMADAIINGVIQ
ncbi:MAG: N-acetylmuramoyl-L-alanine amidase, partial [Peptostreptococcaceae bacterium]